CTEELPKISKQLDAASLVTDFSPLKIKKLWIDTILESLRIPVYEVDAHNIIPCWETSLKQEYAAYTIRPKIHKRLSEYLVPFPYVQRHPYGDAISTFLSTEQYINQISVDTTVKPVSNCSAGANAAQKVLNDFVNRIHSYDEDHNDPNKNAQSNLSPYLHFGQLSAQRVVLRINQSVQSSESKEAFLEELIVRRELSDNYCYYNNNYDTFTGFPDWAKKTLNEHRSDPREFVYPQEEFEQAKTHDPLWNAAQLEMITTGKMHGYMRMYWAKKILEWTNSPEEAQSIAIYLNDKYELDGRDPNGYTGIAWSIGGVHDRAWPEHDVYGKIRYMNYNGAKRKFDTEAYISKFSDLI
ncbi:deoxyribodipyrimidine photo-lyase, partial [candidate division WWE3 bacterium]|nr:deoxyribodipyrimidine photo-lyase [candidate division WWE3 bacterium]